jgi:uncharacterized protein YqgQ
MIIKDAKTYENEIEMIKRELEKLPDSHLTKNKSRYYETTGTVQKGITKNKSRVMQLARKAYLSKRLKHLEWNCSLMEKQSPRYKKEDPMEIIRELPSFYRALPISYFFHHSVYDQLEKTPKGSAGYSDELIYLTLSGIYVRSKSERTIADALYQSEIPFRYETALKIDGSVRYPDFTIYRPSDGNKILWEHFGLMDEEGYKRKMIEKLVSYIRHGFFPFDNLICTYEQDIQNLAHIHAIIDLFLLQR